MNLSNKKWIAFLLIVFVQLTAFAQEGETKSHFERKGKILTGASFGFTFADSNVDNNPLNNSESITISSTVSGGYFITDKSALGLAFDYNYTNTNFEKGSQMEFTNSSNIVFSPFFRTHPINSLQNLFFQGQFNIGLSKSKSKLNLEDTEGNSFSTSLKNDYFLLGYSAGLGFDIKIMDDLFFEPMLLFTSNKLDDRNGNEDVKRKLLFLTVGMFFTF